MASHAASPLASGDAGCPDPANWSAVYAMALCTFTLIASEFLPVSLLSPIAQTLALSEGQAGRAIAISGVSAVVTSLGMSSVIGRIDRRHAMLALTTLMAVSGAIVALAPSYLVLMIGRVLLGVVIGGFWSMSVSVVMRLVPAEAVPKGLAILNGGVAVATTLAAPLGSFLGGLIGWRGAFFCVVPIALVAVIWQAMAVPALPAEARRSEASMFGLLRRPPVLIGMTANLLMFTGQFALFTYLRPFLEQVTHVSLPVLSGLLLVIGVAGFSASTVVSKLLAGRLYVMLAAFPALMGLAALGLAAFGSATWFAAIMLAVWGFVGTAAQVAWWSWLAETLPDDAEKGGGLLVAITQMAITLGATVGGSVFDWAGPTVEFAGSGVILLAAAAVALATRQLRRKASIGQLVA